jgi:predicted phosphoadenosine phosphosulfate sulfurtransferase
VLKRPIGITVLEASRQRIEWTFDHFERVYCSFSAGKDSTIMLHLVADEAKKRGRKFGVLLVDLEGQYKITMEHAQKCVEMYRNLIDLHWVCLPIHLRNAVSVYEPFWLCWDETVKDAWIRQPPDIAITSPMFYPFFSPGMEFEEFVPEFGEWYSQGRSCACLVGIRTDESLNRFRTIVQSKKETYNGIRWTSKVTDNCYNVYPIYDWKASDIWVYHAKNPEKPYNRLYDLMHRAGLPMGLMRICQPYGDDQRRGLWLFHLIEPETWARVVARVNGANGGATYIQEWGNINGYRQITKPPGHTWQSFAELLVKSMPTKTGIHYKNKIILFQKWWQEKGYPQGIPDEAAYEMEAARRAPSWRRVCKSLLRNDYWMKGLGFSQHKSGGYKKYLDLMERRKKQWHVIDDLLSFVYMNPEIARLPERDDVE